MNKVHFASAHVPRLSADVSLPARFQRLLDQYDFEAMFKDKTIAMKMHFGGYLGYTTIHPLFVKILVSRIKQAGGRPFAMDGSFSIGEAISRGYTEEVIGCPLVGAGGINDKYYYEHEVNYETLDTVKLCGNVCDADALLVFSHGKGHGHTAFGGAIKNIAMGCVAYETRGKIHALMAGHFNWDKEACTDCRQCEENCPTGAVKFDVEGNFGIEEHNCRYCMHCVKACPAECLTIDQSRYRCFQDGMALATKACLEHFDPANIMYITALMNITPMCDCWGFSTQALVPDIGIVASNNIVAIEQAALDLIDADKYIPGTLPEQLQMGTEGHLFQRIHNKDPYIQVEAAAENGLGSREYELVEIE